MPLSESGSALFAGSIEEFVEMACADTLAAHLTRQYDGRWGTATKPEIESWRNSLKALAEVVRKTRLADVGVAIELKLPLTSLRVDASFVAKSRDGHPRVVLVELKQWERATPSLNPGNVLVDRVGERLHPSVQCAGYVEHLRGAHSAFTERGFELRACAYLHNMKKDAAAAITGQEHTQALADAPLFSAGDVALFESFLGESLGGGGGMELLPELIAGRYSPSKALLEGIRESYAANPAWTLLGEQRLAYNAVLGFAERAADAGEKVVIRVLGGPGTGKSVIAAHLLIELFDGGRRRVAHATGSKALRTNLVAIAPPGARSIFHYFNGFERAAPNQVDVLVLDEAHRIRNRAQARELVRSARVSVFFLDERQNVRPTEIGSPGEIRLAGKAEGAWVVPPISLTSQFRCNGSSGYVGWVNELMSPDPRPAGGWRQAGDYDLRLFDSPGAMEAAIHEQARAGATARLVAGFCWRWSDPRRDGTLVDDVVIGDWQRPWNEKPPEQQRPKKPIPRADLHPFFKWATEPERIREVGCIYSAQGFEFDYVGVILGNDLVWRNGEGWVEQRAASHDYVIRDAEPEEAGEDDAHDILELLQHVYRVLLTRGMKGTFIYSTDPKTRAFLRTLIPDPA